MNFVYNFLLFPEVKELNFKNRLCFDKVIAISWWSFWDTVYLSDASIPFHTATRQILQRLRAPEISETCSTEKK